MRFAIQLMIDGGDTADETQEIISFDRTDGALSIDELGLTLEEAKTALAALQIAITDAQVMEHSRRQRPCPDCCRPRWLKDNRTITVRTCFGKLKLPSPRYRRCRCQAMPGFVAPVVAALPEPATPDLLALEARWASLAAYGVTAALLADVLPIDGTVNASTIRNDAMRVAERLETELGPEQGMFASGCQAEWNRMPVPEPPVTIGIDGGYVRSWTARWTTISNAGARNGGLHRTRRKWRRDSPNFFMLPRRQAVAFQLIMRIRRQRFQQLARPVNLRTGI